MTHAIDTFRFDEHISFDYVNHRGEHAERRVKIKNLQFGCNEYYPEPQWLLHGIDIDRDVFRSFALRRIDVRSLRKLP